MRLGLGTGGLREKLKAKGPAIQMACEGEDLPIEACHVRATSTLRCFALEADGSSNKAKCRVIYAFSATWSLYRSRGVM